MPEGPSVQDQTREPAAKWGFYRSCERNLRGAASAKQCLHLGAGEVQEEEPFIPGGQRPDAGASCALLPAKGLSVLFKWTAKRSRQRRLFLYQGYHQYIGTPTGKTLIGLRQIRRSRNNRNKLALWAVDGNAARRFFSARMRWEKSFASRSRVERITRAVRRRSVSS